jgi:hypothetical protein
VRRHALLAQGSIPSAMTRGLSEKLESGNKRTPSQLATDIAVLYFAQHGVVLQYSTVDIVVASPAACIVCLRRLAEFSCKMQFRVSLGQMTLARLGCRCTAPGGHQSLKTGVRAGNDWILRLPDQSSGCIESCRSISTSAFDRTKSECRPSGH